MRPRTLTVDSLWSGGSLSTPQRSIHPEDIYSDRSLSGQPVYGWFSSTIPNSAWENEVRAYNRTVDGLTLDCIRSRSNAQYDDDCRQLSSAAPSTRSEFQTWSSYIPTTIMESQPSYSDPEPLVHLNNAPSFHKNGITFEDVPFIESCRAIQGRLTPGIIRVRELPYSVTRQEIIGHLNKFAGILPDKWCIHFAVDKQTLRTNACFAEYTSVDAAEEAVRKYLTHRERGTQLRIHNRFINVELSSVEQMMKAIYPRADQIEWHGLNPILYVRNSEYIGNSLNALFFTKEELYLFVKHAELPNKSQHATKNPQRTYECFISTLLNFPWAAVDLYTIEMRDQLFETARTMIRLLLRAVNHTDSHIELNLMLLKHLLQTCLVESHGFSEQQKAELWYAAEIAERLGFPEEIYRSDRKVTWAFETLKLKPFVDECCVEVSIPLQRW
jgi:hypothetical protein